MAINLADWEVIEDDEAAQTASPRNATMPEGWELAPSFGEEVSAGLGSGNPARIHNAQMQVYQQAMGMLNTGMAAAQQMPAGPLEYSELPEGWEGPGNQKDPIQAANEMRADYGDPGTSFTKALARSTGMFQDAKSPEQLALEARIAATEQAAGVEEIPTGLKVATAMSSGFSKAAGFPEKLAESLNDITGWSRVLDATSGGLDIGNQSRTEAALKAMVDEEQRMSAADAQIHGGTVPYQIVEGAARGLAELPMQMLPAARARSAAQALKIAAGTAGVMGATQTYVQERGSGREMSRALPRAALSGIITAATTKAFGTTGAESILRQSGATGFKAKLKEMAVHAGWEIPEEMIDQVGQDILERFDNNPGKSLEDTIREVFIAGAVGGLVGGTVTAGRALLPSGRPGPVRNSEPASAEAAANQGATQAATAQFNADRDAEELFQLRELQKSGKLTVDDAQRLGQLIENQANPQSALDPEEEAYLQAEREGMNDIEVVPQSDKDGPFARQNIAGQFMGVNWQTGKVQVFPEEFKVWLKSLPPEKRAGAVKARISEERIHLKTEQRDAERHWDALTPVEQALEVKLYTGKWALPEGAQGQTGLTGTHIGFEAIRRRAQRLGGMESSEVAEMVGRERWTHKSLEALNDAVYGLRKAWGTDASKEQQAYLNKVLKNIEVARNAIDAGASGEQPAALRISGNASAAVNDFAQKFMKGPDEGFNMTNADTQKAGLAMTGVADLDALLSMRRSAVEERNKLKAEAQRLMATGDRDAGMKAMNRMAAVGPKTQYIREAIEMATNLGSWQEGERNKFGARPLDWQKNPGVAKWLQEHGAEVGVQLPEESPAAIRRGGPSKRGQEIADQKRRIAEMQAKARGEELPPELQTQEKPASGSVDAPVAPEDRVSAEASGALPRITSKDLESKAAEVLQGEINLPKEQRPSFDEFATWARRNMEGARPEQLRDMWEDRVWGALLRAEPERLESWRKVLGLERNYGARPIVPIAPPEGFALANPGDKVLARQDKLAGESKQRYRNKIIGAIARKLIRESIEGRAALNRENVSIDDIAFDNEKTVHGPYTEINRDDLADPKRLNAILRDQARGSSSDPESASRRLLAVVDSAGKVHLLTTYNDAGTQWVTDPAGPRIRNKPSREINKTFLNQYRPFASLLLTDPVKGLRQTFESVSDFNDKMGKEASERARIGDWEIVPEGPAPDDFEAEGTPGIEGEGGSFMGPGKQTAVPGARPGAMESDAPLTYNEADSVLNHIMDETGGLGSPDDVKLSLDGLVAAAASGRLTPPDRMAINGYRKVFDAIEATNPNLSREEILDRMAESIYATYQTSENAAEFVKKSLAQFAPQSPRPAGPQPKKIGVTRNLTQRRGVAPTTVRGLQGPTMPPEAAGRLRGAPESRPDETAQERAQREQFIARRSQALTSDRPLSEMSAREAEQRATVQELEAGGQQLSEAQRRRGIQITRERVRRRQGILPTYEQAQQIYDENFPEKGVMPGAIRRRGGPTITNIIRDFGSIYDSWMVDRIERRGGPNAEVTATKIRSIVDRTKELYGSLTPKLDKAKRLAGGNRIPAEAPASGSTTDKLKQLINKADPIRISPQGIKAVNWLNQLTPIKGAPFAAIANTVGAIENTIPVPDYAKEVVEAGREANLEAGQMLEPVVPGFQSTQSVAVNMTPFAMDQIKHGGKVFDQWVEEMAIANDKTKASVKRAFKKLYKVMQDDASSDADLQVANDEFMTELPEVVTQIDYKGRQVNLIKAFRASGRFQRNVTPIGFDVILQGPTLQKRGEGRPHGMWEKWTAALAHANRVPIAKVRTFFREWQGHMDANERDSDALDKVRQDFTRKFPQVVTHIRHDGRWQAVVHADLYNYLENAASRAAHVRAFRESFPSTKEGRAALAEMMANTRRELGRPYKKDLNALALTMQGHPTDDYSGMGGFAPTEPMGQSIRLFNQTLGNLFARMALTGQLFVQPGEVIAGSTPMFLGYKNYLKGMAQLKQIYPELEKAGMVNRVIYDFSWDPKSPMRSAFRLAGNTISKGFIEQALNELQEAGAAATARVTADNIKSGELSDWEKRMLPRTFEAMGFNADEVMGLMQGDEALLGQFQRKASAFLTSGNKAISEGSRLGANRLFNSIFRFQSYPMMKLNQFRRTAGALAEAMQDGTPYQKRTAAEQFTRFMFGNAAQGALTVGITSLFFGGIKGLEIKMEEAKDEPLEFLAEAFLATLSGPLYIIWRGMTAKGILGIGENAARTAFPYTVMTDLIDFAQGAGKYRDLDSFDKIGKFLAAKTPGTKAIATGMAMFGLGMNDQKLDASIDGFFRWRREELGFSEHRSFGMEDDRKEFRTKMKRAVEALRNGDEEKFYEAYQETADEILKMEKGTALAEAFNSAKILTGSNGAKLTDEQVESLRGRIGDDAYERIEYFDLMLEEAGKGVALPAFDE